MLCNDLYKKVNIARSFFFCDRVLEPRFVASEIEVFDRVYVGRKEAFKDELTDFFNLVIIITELV